MCLDDLHVLVVKSNRDPMYYSATSSASVPKIAWETEEVFDQVLIMNPDNSIALANPAGFHQSQQ